MKHVFIELSEQERDIVLNVLEKYCVPKRVRTIKEDNMPFGYNYTYEIEVDLSLEEKNGKSPYDFIIEKVDEALELEHMFKRRSYKKSKEQQKSKEEAPSDVRLNIKTKLKQAIMSSLFNNKPEGFRQIAFDDLTKKEQEALLEDLPEEKLKSKDCRILMNDDSEIIVEFVGEN